ncbi:unnamed protein product [Effrenium voratum]|nr:unnamed protein product [Effrenium voratum]
MVLNSSSYFNSASEAVRALGKANPETAYLNGSSGSLHSIGMLAAGCLSGYLALLTVQDVGLFTSQNSSYYVENRVAVVVAVGVLGASVASCFMGLFDVVFDTLLFCWLSDVKPTGNVVFVPPSLQAALGPPPRRGPEDLETGRSTGKGMEEEKKKVAEQERRDEAARKAQLEREAQLERQAQQIAEEELRRAAEEREEALRQEKVRKLEAQRLEAQQLEAEREQRREAEKEKERARKEKELREEEAKAEKHAKEEVELQPPAAAPEPTAAAPPAPPAPESKPEPAAPDPPVTAAAELDDWIADFQAASPP